MGTHEFTEEKYGQVEVRLSEIKRKEMTIQAKCANQFVIVYFVCDGMDK